MSSIVHFEVYVQETRGWVLQARFPVNERDDAIAEARHLEESVRKPVRVIRETYFTDSNDSDNAVVWMGRIKPKQKVTGMEVRGAEPSGGPGGAHKLRKTSKATASDSLFRLAIVVIISLATAAIGAGIAAKILMSTDSASLSVAARSLIMFMTFIGLFLVTAVPLIFVYIPLDQLFGGDGNPNPKILERERARQRQKAEEQRRDSLEKAAAAVIAGGKNADDMRPPAGDPASPASPAAVEATTAATATQILAEIAEQRKQELREQRLRELEDKTRDPMEIALEQEELAAEERDRLAEIQRKREQEAAGRREAALEAERLRGELLQFLSGAVSVIKISHPKLDTYNRFGVNLYLAGACETLAEVNGLFEQDFQTLVREATETIGTKSDQARQLVERLPAYRLESRYKDMIAAGRAAMSVHLSGHSDPFLPLDSLLKEWNTPQSRMITGASTITIMFTDMVGSTDMTQAMGDAAAQDVVRAHNTIVRRALAQFTGKEVKHTGDGIMASFDDPFRAVLAAIDIQQKAAEHTARWPRLPVVLRLGMNTGEPIMEENDYFGATVQIAARVCAAAGEGMIFLSEATKAFIADGSGLLFHNHGPMALKGVKEQRTLYEAVWNPARAAELEALRHPVASAAPASVAAPEAALPALGAGPAAEGPMPPSDIALPPAAPAAAPPSDQPVDKAAAKTS